MNRFFKNSPTDFIHDYNIHRVAISCLRLAHKMLDDEQLDIPSQFTKVAGLSITEFNTLEQEALMRLNCQLYVSESEYIMTKKKLVDLARLLDFSNNRILWVYLNTTEREFLNRLPVVPAAYSPPTTEAVDTDMDGSAGGPTTDELLKEMKELAPGYDEPIRYDSTSQQWFYKKSDVSLEQNHPPEPTAQHFLS